MATCIFCSQDVEKTTLGVNIRGLHLPRTEIDALMKVCPSCGGLQLVWNDYFQYMNDGFPPITDSDLESIDMDSLFEEAVLPGRDTGEEIKWINPNDLPGDSWSDFYEKKFENGIGNWAKTVRLVHFLKMDKTERQSTFGPLRCTSLRVGPGGEIIFREGRTRFFLFKYLGATRIPVSISPEFQENASTAGIPLYDSQT